MDTLMARARAGGPARGRSDEEVGVLLREQDTAEVAPRLLRVVRVVRARGVHVEEVAQHRARQEDRAAAALGEQRVDDLDRARDRERRVVAELEAPLERHVLAG